MLESIGQFLSHFFRYDQLRPLLFTSVSFWIFLLVVWGGYLFLHTKLRVRSFYLLLVSLLFYYKSCGLFFLFLLLSIGFNYGMALCVERMRNEVKRKWLLGFTVGLNLLGLCYFKYTEFLLDTLNVFFGTSYVYRSSVGVWLAGVLGQEASVGRELLLPVGLSFYTFQALSYVVDVYRGDLRALRNPVDFGFYLSFFPQLVAGPIVRASEFIPQIGRSYVATQREAGHALYLILVGLCKKVVLSDYVALNLVDRVFAQPEAYSGVENLLAVYGYTLQIYCDFSGYTDIAIGIALLLGFHLSINFNFPYRATSITNFWRRWHISLSTWLRDYLYIPLGGNRCGVYRQALHLMATMLLGGLWHGASWTFVVWGGVHGLLLIVSKWVDVWCKPWLKRQSFVVLRQVVVFHLVAALWVLFRASDFSQAMVVFSRIGSGLGFSHLLTIVEGYGVVFLLMVLGYTLHWIPLSWIERVRGQFILSPIWMKFLITVVVILIILHFQSADLQPFIYFAF